VLLAGWLRVGRLLRHWPIDRFLMQLGCLACVTALVFAEYPSLDET
jgi:hypothetical protein